MKKIITLILAAVILVSGVDAFAATTSLVPSRSSVVAGQTFTVAVTINPQGTNYAEKLEVKFPADLLEVRSFAFNNAWTVLNQPSYDLTDNTAGVMIKSAGYPAGFTSPTLYGTITFYAKKAGAANITIGGNSSAFDATGQSALTGAALAMTVENAPIVTPTASPVASVSVQPTVGDESAASSSVVTLASSTDVAAVENAGMSAWTISLIVLAIIIIGVLGYFVTKKYRNS